MHKLIFRLGLILSFLTTACQNTDSDIENMLEETPYFDLKGLLDQQLASLNELNPQVEVMAKIGKDTETQTIQKDSSDWAEALKLYLDADINKPVLRGEYTVKDSTLEDEGLQAKIYTAKNQKEAEVPFLKVVFKDSSSAPSYIESMFREENLLYSTYRNMRLQFDDEAGKLRLTSYETRGRQKMIFRDSVTYQTKGLLKY